MLQSCVQQRARSKLRNREEYGSSPLYLAACAAQLQRTSPRDDRNKGTTLHFVGSVAKCSSFPPRVARRNVLGKENKMDDQYRGRRRAVLSFVSVFMLLNSGAGLRLPGSPGELEPRLIYITGTALAGEGGMSRRGVAITHDRASDKHASNNGRFCTTHQRVFDESPSVAPLGKRERKRFKSTAPRGE